MSSDPDRSPPWCPTLVRLLGIFASLLVIAIAAFILLDLLDGAGDGGRIAVISLTWLLGVPYALGALAAFLIDPRGRDAARSGYIIPLWILIGVLVIGGAIFREGAVCLLMAGFIWIPMIMLGVFTLKRIQRKNQDVSKSFEASLIAVIPAMLLGVDFVIPQQISTYEVRRSIVLDAEPEDIWPMLLSLPDISCDEGRFTTAQSIIRIPRPRAAVVAGEGVGAIRHAQWGDNITFEEHITHWTENEMLSWTFVFPNDSISRYTDRHISPDGEHLRIQEGGYRLEPARNQRTRLTLYTRYEAETPMNAYAALWGEFFLGGIQVNILDIIEDRVNGCCD